MANIKIAAVLRAGVFSPNHIGNDASILNMTADQLRKRGCEVNMYSEEQLIAGNVKEDIIINMCRLPQSIEMLQRLEDNGALVINSGYGIENCVRERLTRILVGSNIPFPESIIVDTNEHIKDRLVKQGFTSCWVKKADGHAMHKEDITHARHAEEAQELLQEYFLRGITKAVISKHLNGPLIKFYGVANTNFFHWYFPFKKDVAGLSDEVIKEMEKVVKELCRQASEELNVVVYGGECIACDDGVVRLIDFKDWSSFAPCRQEAAPYIAKHVLNAIKNRNK